MKKQSPPVEECFCRGLGPQITQLLSQMAPGEATGHFRQSRIEFLKGIRALLDKRIEELSKDKVRRGAKVAVE